MQIVINHVLFMLKQRTQKHTAKRRTIPFLVMYTCTCVQQWNSPTLFGVCGSWCNVSHWTMLDLKTLLDDSDHVLDPGTHLCIYKHAPKYLKELITIQTWFRSLRSTNCKQHILQRTKLRTKGDRAFWSAVHHIWNSLSKSIKGTTDSFKKGILKRDFF